MSIRERMFIKKISGRLKISFISCHSRSCIIFILLFLLLSQNTNAVAKTGYGKNTVVFGGVTDTPPYEFIDKDGLPSGFTVELTKAIADEIGWNAEIKLISSDQLKKDFESGKIDIIERADYFAEKTKLVEYSIPYHEFRYSVFINTGDMEYFSMYGLKGLTPVTYEESFSRDYMNKNFPADRIKTTDRLIETISYISMDKNSFTIINKYLGLYLIKKYDIENVTTAGDPVLIQRYHYASLKSKSHLIAGLNEGLNILKANGKFNRIYDKWFSVIRKDRESLSILKIASSVITLIFLLSMVFFARIWVSDKQIKAETKRLADELNRHKFSEKALMESEERSRLIIENAPLGILHFNTEGIITTCNESFVKIIGSSRNNLIGLKMLQLPDDRVVESIKSAINGTPSTYEGLYASTTAVKSTYIRAMFTPIKLPDGTITGGLGIIEDNTARKKYEEAILNAKYTAESASSIKSDFLANMSHEVRTPLNGILGMLQLIQTTGVNEEQANYVNIAIKSGMRLTRLLNDILDLSRVESDKLILTETQFSLREIFNFINERYSTDCEEKGITLLLKIEKNTPIEVVGDETRIRQIIVNLVSNAVKFTNKGSIVVNLSAEDVSCDGEVDIIISVRDTGIGIADDMMTQIFEPFRQGENSYKRTFQGAGLGLTLVKHLVNLMNGTIKIDSTPGKGTAVRVSISVKLPENHAIDLKPVMTEKLNKSGNLCTILIAEDERINRLALKRILEKMGYHILEAENGSEALKILDNAEPDLILMDIQMPKMDGIEAAKLIRDKEKYGEKSSIPIIALTAYTMPEDREKISAAGFDDYISKPVNMDYLVKSITKFIGNGNNNS